VEWSRSHDWLRPTQAADYADELETTFNRIPASGDFADYEPMQGTSGTRS